MQKLKHHSGLYTRMLLLGGLMLLGGCAVEAMHNKGMDLVHEGKVEEGLTQLEAASKAEPDNPRYRSDVLRTKAQAVNSLLAQASGELGVGHVEAAQGLYERVLKLDKDNRVAKTALDTIEMGKRHETIIGDAQKLYDQGDFDGARATLKPVLVENGKNPGATSLLRQIDEQQRKSQIAEPSLLRKFKKPVSLQFRDANVKMVFEALSRITGINVLLDKDIRSDLKASIFVKDVAIDDAIDLILMQSQLEKKILSDNTVYIYPNNPAKTKELQELKIRSFHLTNADPKVMVTMIKTLLKTKDIFVHEKTNSIIMRDTPEAIDLAAKMIADQDVADPEVMLEVEVLEIDRSRLTDLGIKYPSQMTFSPVTSLVTAAGATGTAATTTSQLTLDTLKNINSSNIAVSPTPSITLNAMLQDSDTNILSSPRLRVRNREKAKIMIGDRVPIITNSLTPTTTGTGVVTGTVTYQDVGLKFDVEPEIHTDNAVTIKLTLEVSSLGNAVTNTATGSVVYTVQTRNTTTSLRLNDGETQILAGLVEDKDTSTSDKIPALGQIPILGHLFGHDNKSKSKKEVILSITPHVVNGAKPLDAHEAEFWSGTETDLRSNPVMLKPLGTVVLSNSSASAGRFAPPASSEVASSRTTGGISPVPAPTTPQAASAVAPAPVASMWPTGVAPAPASAVAGATPQAQAENGDAAKAAAEQSLKFAWQGPAQAKVGEKITLSLVAPSTLGMKSISMQIGFDPETLKIINVVEGTSLKHGEVQAAMNKTLNQGGGNIAVELSGEGASGSATVVTLTFEVTAPAQGTTISIDSISGSRTNGEQITIDAPDPQVITLVQ